MEKKSNTKINFLNHVHYFRAFAIINVVFGHLFMFPENYKNSFGISILTKIKFIIFQNGTIYFIFISGFLFSYLAPKFKLKKYYKNKFQYVIVPYIILSILFFTINNYQAILSNSSKIKILKDFLYSLMLGKVQLQFWYIPFIIVVFIISPLLLKIPENKFYILVLITMPLPLIFSRTGINITINQYLYLIPIYIIGMFIAQNYTKKLEILKKILPLTISVSIITTIIMFYIFSENIKFYNISLNQSLYYIQKISITFVILCLFSNFEHIKSKFLSDIATYSFSIYFLHIMVKEYLNINILYNIANSLSSYTIFIVVIIHSVAIFLITFLISIILKYIFKEKSRFIIGS